MTADETRALLEGFSRAWNDHDIDAMMAFMADDCIFLASSGPARDGARHVGRDAVRGAYLAVLQDMPDAHWASHGIHVAGDAAFSLWTLTGTRRDGTVVDVDGIDHFEFEGRRIRMKNAFRKARTAVHQDRPDATVRA